MDDEIIKGIRGQTLATDEPEYQSVMVEAWEARQKQLHSLRTEMRRAMHRHVLDKMGFPEASCDCPDCASDITPPCDL